MTKVGVPDMQRLLTELTAGGEVEPGVWEDAEGIDEDVFGFLFEQFTAGIANAVNEGEVPMEAAIPSLIGTAFMLGWETHKQYGR